MTATPLLTSTPVVTLPPSPSRTPTVSATVTATPTNALAYYYLDWEQVLVYPNPAKDVVHLLLHLKEAGQARVVVYNLAGDRIAEVAQYLPAGRGQVLDWQASGVAPGIYLCRVVITDAEGRVVLNQSKKVAVIR